MVKKKNKICINAVDKYLQQMKYRRELKKTAKYKSKTALPKVVIPRMKSKRLQELELIMVSKLENQIIAFDAKVPVVKLKHMDNLLEMNHLSYSSHSRTVAKKRKSDPIAENCLKKSKKSIEETGITVSSQKKLISRHKNRKTTTNKNCRQKVKNSKCSETYEKENFSVWTVNEKMQEVKSPTTGTNHKTKQKIPSSTTHVKNPVKRKPAERCKPPCNLNEKKNRNCSNKKRVPATSLLTKMPAMDEENLSEISTEDRCASFDSSHDNTSPLTEFTTNFKKSTKAGRKKMWKNEEMSIINSKKSGQLDVLPNEPCLCDSVSFEIDETSQSMKESSMLAKYKLCIEKLKSLTAEMIEKFIKENKQYYIDLKKNSFQRKVNEKGKKKCQKELKDSFKCNPFNSAQQVAIYLTLRKLFNIPSGSFMECRYFFTLLIPEICCQLFAKIFEIKVSVAPRLMKKLYPQPVCPV